MLLQQLPPGARRGGQRWSTESELIAAVIDHLAMLTFITLKANGSKSARKPKPVQRPRDAVAWVSASTPRDVGHAPGKPGEGPVKAGSWADAALALSGVPGVKVEVSHG